MFGPFALDLRTGELMRTGQRVRLPGHAFQVLAMLLEQPGETVTREALHQRLWSGDTFVDFDQGLNNAIKRLRESLGDSAQRPRYIETLPRLGYRFVGEVKRDEPVEAERSSSAPADPADSAPIEGTPVAAPAPSRERPERWWRVVAVIATVLAVAGLFWLTKRWRTASAPARQPISSLAVLPLTNQTGDTTQSYFVDGMTDELTTSLAQLNNLKVISETSAMHYRGTTKPVRQIAGELGVDAIVEGSVLRSGDKVRITAQLIDARNDRHLWAESYVRGADDVLGLQQEVVRTIADRIHVTLTPAEAQRLQTLPTHNQRANDVYLRASYLTDSGQFSQSDNQQTIELANEAVALDPAFAQAYVVLAQGYVEKIFFWSGGKEDDEKASVALDKALALNPNLAEAYNVRSNLYYNHLHGYDLVNSAVASERAVSLNPNDSWAHHQLGGVFVHSGLHDRAIKEYRSALQLDPMNDGAKYRLSRALWQAQRFQESIENYNRYNIKSIEEVLPLMYLGRRQQAWDLIAELTPQAGTVAARQGFSAGTRAALCERRQNTGGRARDTGRHPARQQGRPLPPLSLHHRCRLRGDGQAARSHPVAAPHLRDRHAQLSALS